MAKEFAIQLIKRQEIRDRKWTYVVERREVRVMARAEGFAMVRRKGCMPYACSEKDLEPMPPAQGGA